MKIAVSSTGDSLDSLFSQMFGRCPVHIIVDPDTMEFQAVPNQAAAAAGGAWIQAAQEVAVRDVKAVVTGHVGPNAYQVFAAAGVPVFTFTGCTVRQAVDAYSSGQLSQATEATGPAHAGMGTMRGPGPGAGMGAMRRPGPGAGIGGRGKGRRGGRGLGPVV